MGSTGNDSERFFQSDIFDAEKRPRRPPSGGSIREPARDIPVHTKCDVLVVGGGPAGTAAAVTAARLGADVVLLERYNHLGGLSTGGLVIWIDRMTDWTGRHVIRGFAEEVLDRLPRNSVVGPARKDWGSRDEAKTAFWSPRLAAFHGIVTHSPTLDPEWLKAESLEIALAAGVHPVFHGWGVRPLVEAGRVAGCIFESKQGRRVILGKVTVDATGDGDLYAAAGAPHDSTVNARDIHACMNTAWMFGGVDMAAFLSFRMETPDQYAEFLALGRERMRYFEKAVVSWRNDIALFLGPRLSGYSALDVEDLSEVEIRSRRLMIEHLHFYRRHAPGFSAAFLLLSAPQIGVRHGRRLIGRETVSRDDWDGRVRTDEIGVSPAPSPKFANVSIPYGALLPQGLNGLLAPGRHLACDISSHTFLREIPQCWTTGQAAGVAAALAANTGCDPADVAVADIRAALVTQGAFLNPQPTPAPAES
jgi:hypothetical protein